MMRWILIACVVLIGAAAASAQEDITAPWNVTDWECTEGWHKVGASCEMDEHPCGEGPHEIKVDTSHDRCNTSTCNMERSWTGRYVAFCIRTAVACMEIHTETWTDWPECDGAERIPVLIDVPTVNEGDKVEWMLHPRDPDEDRP